MAESGKGTESSSKAKEKVSVLDDDISKNFLGSWNTNIGAESDDNSMDFKFEPVKGKKKDFCFDKLDMDFSLDGEFDKIKSFKVDMGDLDFSSPPKKTSTKSKETALDFSPPKTSTKSKGKDFDFSSPPKEGTKGKGGLEGESAKSNKGKQDCFSFSFDFNELDKFDLDAVLPAKTKELNKGEGNRGVKIHSADNHEDQGSKMLLADTDAGDDSAVNARTMPVETKNSKENLVACGGDLDLLPEIDPSKSSTLQDKIESKQSKTISERENTLQRSPVLKKTYNESYEESQLQNQSAQSVQDQTHSKPAPIVSEGPITDRAQRIEKQSDQVASFFNKSYEKPKVQNQPAWSLMDKISAFSVSEQMQTTSAGDNSDDADSKMQDLNSKVDPSLTSENEYFPVNKMTLQDDSKRLQNIPEIESEDTDGENNVPESCNVLHGDMDAAMVAENVLHVKGSPVADPSRLGAHFTESISGKQKTPAEIASSRVVRFNLKPSTQVLPRSNLVSLNRNAISSMNPSPSGARHNPHSAQSRNKFEKSSGSFTQEEIGESFASENNTKSVSGQRAREDCNAMVTQMKINLGAISGPNDGQAAERGTTFLENEKKKEDTKSPRWCQHSKWNLQDDSKCLQNIPEVESENTDGENNVPESCNVLHGDMDTAMLAENVLHVKGSPVADPSRLGAHVAESISGKQKTPAEIASSRVVRFNLKPITKDKIPASTQVFPRSNLVSLNRNAISSMNPSPSGASISYRHSPHSAQSRSKVEKSSGSFTQEEIGESFASENNTKSVSGQRAREDCNAMATQMKINLGAISWPNDGKAAERGTTFLENEKKKEDTKSSSFQVQSSRLPDWTSESNNQGSKKLTPKIQSFQSVRKLKMDTIVGKLSTLKVSKKLSDLKTSSSPTLEDKIVIARKLDSNGMNVTRKTVQLVGSGKPQPPTPSFKAHSLAPSTKTVQLLGSGKPKPPTPSSKVQYLAPSPKTVQLPGSGKPQPSTPSFKAQSLATSIKRKISEVSDAAPVISHPSKRLSASQRRNSKEDSEGVAQEEVAQEEVGVHENIPDYSLKRASEKQPESTFEMALEMKFADLGVTPVMENDGTIEKAEACGKELDQICIMLRKKQEEAKELLVRALVANNKLLLLSNPMHALKLGQTQNLASRLLSKELPSRCVEQAME